jgi:hypothetical protein
MAATNEQIQQAVESFFLLFNGVVVFCKLFLNKSNKELNLYFF